MKLHHDYLLRILDLDNKRLSKISAQEIISKKLYWYRDLEDLMSYCGLSSDRLQNVSEWQNLFVEIRDTYAIKNKENLKKQISESRYSVLRALSFGKNYMRSHEFSMDEISILMKSRSSVLNYNLSPLSTNQVCVLCCSAVEDNWLHFLSACPSLFGLRFQSFQKEELRPEEIADILNGNSWKKLIEFVKRSYQYWLEF